MSDGPTTRPRWQIDQVLNDLMGADIRVEAKSFSPLPWTVGKQPRLLPVHQLILPDNSRAGSLPVFFEGRLMRFERKIGVVFVHLDSLATSEGSSEGTVLLRGKMVVLLHGPAVVELAFPFQAERLPSDAENYWRDLRAPRAQLEFPFGLTPTTPADIGSRRSNPTRSHRLAGVVKEHK